MAEYRFRIRFRLPGQLRIVPWHLYTFHPDGSRIQRVFRKMIRGLYSNHHGETKSLGPISMRLWQHSPLSPIPQDFVDLLSQTPTTPIGHARYRFAVSEELPKGQPVAGGTVHFFDRMHFVFAAYPSAENDRLESPRSARGSRSRGEPGCLRTTPSRWTQSFDLVSPRDRYRGTSGTGTSRASSTQAQMTRCTRMPHERLRRFRQPPSSRSPATPTFQRSAWRMSCCRVSGSCSAAPK